MKVDILTIHFGVNYGSALQTYALSRIIQELGNQCQVINYIPDRYRTWNLYGKNKVGKYPLPLILIWFILTEPKRQYQRFLFSNFLNRNLSLTKIYRQAKELNDNPPVADIYVVGSDQVWNYDYNINGDYSYFLDFVPEKSKKISYAASIGKDKLNEEQTLIFHDYLSKFDAITVREKTAKQILDACLVNSQVVLDPTFLLTAEEWAKVAKKIKVKDEYLLVYVMDNLFEDLIDIAYELKKKYGYKIYVITFKPTKDKRVDKEYCYLEPKKFLYLLNNAKFVVTNSFHGTAFSVNFNKQFISLGKKEYNSRLVDLLTLFGLEDRYAADKSDALSLVKEEKIDFHRVNSKISDIRKNSKEILKTLLE